MIVKIWNGSGNTWDYLDGFQKVSCKHIIKELGADKDPLKFVNILCHYKDEDKLPLSIEVDVTAEELTQSIYLLNDEGKTIERIN